MVACLCDEGEIQQGLGWRGLGSSRMKRTGEETQRLVGLGSNGEPVVEIEMWLEERQDKERRAVVVTLHTRVKAIAA